MENINNTNIISLLKWYKSKKEISKDEVDKIYHRFMMAYNEDNVLFMKIFLFICGNSIQFNKTHITSTIHFLSTNYPEKLMVNIHLLIEVSEFSFFNFLLQENTINNRVLKYLQYNAKFSDKFKKYLEDTMYISFKNKYFSYKIKENKYIEFINKLNSDKILNAVL